MSIDRSSYSALTAFNAEQQCIFSERVFVGTDYDFVEADNYRSMQVGFKSITVRRTSNGVRAYGNVCLHRNALIDPPGAGKRPFRCGYHGWAYDTNGSLMLAPFADEACIKLRTLPQYPVIETNGLWFVGSTGILPDVEEIPDALDRAGIALDRPFHRGSLDHACNWKLLVENVLESYHLSFVHTQTFRPSGLTSTGTFDWAGTDSISWATLRPDPRQSRDKGLRRLSPNAGHFYHHVYIFPDLFLSNTNGLIGFLSFLSPTSSCSTRLDWLLFELPALKALPESLRGPIRAEAIQFTETALREDKALVELCHQGLASEGSDVQLQPSEGRIQHFHALYKGRVAHASQ